MALIFIHWDPCLVNRRSPHAIPFTAHSGSFYQRLRCLLPQYTAIFTVLARRDLGVIAGFVAAEDRLTCWYRVSSTGVGVVLGAGFSSGLVLAGSPATVRGVLGYWLARSCLGPGHVAAGP